MDAASTRFAVRFSTNVTRVLECTDSGGTVTLLSMLGQAGTAQCDWSIIHPLGREARYELALQSARISWSRGYELQVLVKPNKRIEFTPFGRPAHSRR